MSSFLVLTALSATTPAGRTLFSDVDLTFGRERTGLVGRNGSGKSTLLRIALGDALPASGTVTREGRIAMLRQAVLADPAASIGQELGVADAVGRLARIVAGDGSAEDFDQADWTIEERIDAALLEVGLAGVDLDRPLATLSGGERTRLGIARLTLDAPDLLLLDEPTNNLDADGRAAIGDLLARWRGGAIVASHDRDLLERMDRIVALSPTGVTIHGGGWSDYVAARDAEREAAAADMDRAAGQMRAAARDAQQARERQARRDKAGRTYAASGSAPRILMGMQRQRAENSAGRADRMAERTQDRATGALDAARARIEIVTPLTLDLPPSGLSSSRMLLRFDHVAWGPADTPLFGPLSFTVSGPERIALTGPNGAGKTSLLHIAIGTLAPSSGTVERGGGPIAMLDQQVALLDRSTDLLTNMRRMNPELSDNEAHAALARFAFRAADALKPAAALSGGEAMRAGLACLLSGAKIPQLLILDEPTNHLDLDSIEVLEAALRGYDGALLVVSHDSAFLDAIGVTRTIKVGQITTEK